MQPFGIPQKIRPDFRFIQATKLTTGMNVGDLWLWTSFDSQVDGLYQ